MDIPGTPFLYTFSPNSRKRASISKLPVRKRTGPSQAVAATLSAQPDRTGSEQAGSTPSAPSLFASPAKPAPNAQPWPWLVGVLARMRPLKKDVVVVIVAADDGPG